MRVSAGLCRGREFQRARSYSGSEPGLWTREAGAGAARRPVWLKCSEIGHSGGEMVEAGMTILAISW